MCPNCGCGHQEDDDKEEGCSKCGSENNGSCGCDGEKEETE